MVHNSIIDLIGNTPMIRINNYFKDIPGTFLAKMEPFNPGHSTKDRMALKMIEDAEASGALKKGGTIIECTSGNTGMGLAIIAAIKGYKCIFTINDKQSEDKINTLRAMGAEVIVCPTAVAADHPDSYYSVAKKINNETPNAVWLNQYDNLSNRQAHFESTGPEIWDQTDGNIDIFVAGIGTGGTLSGVGRFLKEKNPSIQVIAVDPEGSVFYHYFKTGKLPDTHLYNVEGIGEDYLVKAVDFEVIDDIIRVNDKNSFVTARRLSREEGIFAGGSSGSAVWVALEVARRQKEPKNIVVILPDSGSRYLSKIYNDEWMIEHDYIKKDAKESF